MDRSERRGAASDRLARVRDLASAAPSVSPDPRDPPRWLLALLLVAIPSHALAVWRVFGQLPPDTRPAMLDSLIFEYIGWYLTQGGRLYIDVWELKPPLAYEVTALGSVIAGGDPVIAHWWHIGLTTAGAIATAVVAGALVWDVTAENRKPSQRTNLLPRSGVSGDGVAAFAAGVALYALPAYHWRAAFGFKPKYFVPLFALLAIFLARRHRPGSAGIAAGAAAGFWQLAIIAPILALGIAADRGGRRAGSRVLGGTLAVFAVSLLPVVAWGSLEAMVTQTLFVPVLVREPATMGAHLDVAEYLFGGSLPVVVLGVVGVVTSLYRRPRSTWWLTVGTAWFGVQVLLVDLDGPPDLFPLVAFLAVGVGLLLGFADGPQRPAAALLAAVAVISVLTLGGFGLGGPAVHHPEPLAYDPGLEPEAPYTLTEQSHLYWSQRQPETCRVFYGPTQRQLVELTGQSPVQTTCGDAGPVIGALRERWASK